MYKLKKKKDLLYLFYSCFTEFQFLLRVWYFSSGISGLVYLAIKWGTKHFLLILHTITKHFLIFTIGSIVLSAYHNLSNTFFVDIDHIAYLSEKEV